jgi:indole-3-glycerol phosphate synthase
VSTFLDGLVDDSRLRAESARKAVSFDELRTRALTHPVGPSFHAALATPGIGVIAEVKRASPSKGDLACDLDAALHAGHYVRAGVAAISVLTEPAKFKGSLQDLVDVAALGTPTLRKDFIVDEYQVWEARLAGASAILLIVAALDDERLVRLRAVAQEASLDVLTEVHDEQELTRAIAVGANIIGVNARDLRTFDVDRDAFARLHPLFPTGVLAVAESGIRGPDDVRAAGAHGADAVLVGETLVTAHDVATMTSALVQAGRLTDEATPQEPRVEQDQ